MAWKTWDMNTKHTIFNLGKEYSIVTPKEKRNWVDSSKYVKNKLLLEKGIDKSKQDILDFLRSVFRLKHPKASTSQASPSKIGNSNCPEKPLQPLKFETNTNHVEEVDKNINKEAAKKDVLIEDSDTKILLSREQNNSENKSGEGENKYACNDFVKNSHPTSETNIKHQKHCETKSKEEVSGGTNDEEAVIEISNNEENTKKEVSKKNLPKTSQRNTRSASSSDSSKTVEIQIATSQNEKKVSWSKKPETRKRSTRSVSSSGSSNIDVEMQSNENSVANDKEIDKNEIKTKIAMSNYEKKVSVSKMPGTRKRNTRSVSNSDNSSIDLGLQSNENTNFANADVPKTGPPEDIKQKRKSSKLNESKPAKKSIRALAKDLADLQATIAGPHSPPYPVLPSLQELEAVIVGEEGKGNKLDKTYKEDTADIEINKDVLTNTPKKQKKSENDITKNKAHNLHKRNRIVLKSDNSKTNTRTLRDDDNQTGANNDVPKACVPETCKHDIKSSKSKPAFEAHPVCLQGENEYVCNPHPTSDATNSEIAGVVSKSKEEVSGATNDKETVIEVSKNEEKAKKEVSRNNLPKPSQRNTRSASSSDRSNIDIGMQSNENGINFANDKDINKNEIETKIATSNNDKKVSVSKMPGTRKRNARSVSSSENTSINLGLQSNENTNFANADVPITGSLEDIKQESKPSKLEHESKPANKRKRTLEKDLADLTATIAGPHSPPYPVLPSLQELEAVIVGEEVKGNKLDKTYKEDTADIEINKDVLTNTPKKQKKSENDVTKNKAHNLHKRNRIVLKSDNSKTNTRTLRDDDNQTGANNDVPKACVPETCKHDIKSSKSKPAFEAHPVCLQGENEYVCNPHPTSDATNSEIAGVVSKSKEEVSGATNDKETVIEISKNEEKAKKEVSRNNLPKPSQRNTRSASSSDRSNIDIGMQSNENGINFANDKDINKNEIETKIATSNNDKKVSVSKMPGTRKRNARSVSSSENTSINLGLQSNENTNFANADVPITGSLEDIKQESKPSKLEHESKPANKRKRTLEKDLADLQATIAGPHSPPYPVLPSLQELEAVIVGEEVKGNKLDKTYKEDTADIEINKDVETNTPKKQKKSENDVTKNKALNLHKRNRIVLKSDNSKTNTRTLRDDDNKTGANNDVPKACVPETCKHDIKSSKSKPAFEAHPVCLQGENEYVCNPHPTSDATNSEIAGGVSKSKEEVSGATIDKEAVIEISKNEEKAKKEVSRNNLPKPSQRNTRSASSSDRSNIDIGMQSNENGINFANDKDINKNEIETKIATSNNDKKVSVSKMPGTRKRNARSVSSSENTSINLGLQSNENTNFANADVPITGSLEDIKRESKPSKLEHESKPANKRKRTLEKDLADLQGTENPILVKDKEGASEELIEPATISSAKTKCKKTDTLNKKVVDDLDEIKIDKTYNKQKKKDKIPSKPIFKSKSKNNAACYKRIRENLFEPDKPQKTVSSKIVVCAEVHLPSEIKDTEKTLCEISQADVEAKKIENMDNNNVLDAPENCTQFNLLASLELEPVNKSSTPSEVAKSELIEIKTDDKLMETVLSPKKVQNPSTAPMQTRAAKKATNSPIKTTVNSGEPLKIDNFVNGENGKSADTPKSSSQAEIVNSSQSQVFIQPSIYPNDVCVNETPTQPSDNVAKAGSSGQAKAEIVTEVEVVKKEPKSMKHEQIIKFKNESDTSVKILSPCRRAYLNARKKKYRQKKRKALEMKLQMDGALPGFIPGQRQYQNIRAETPFNGPFHGAATLWHRPQPPTLLFTSIPRPPLTPRPFHQTNLLQRKACIRAPPPRPYWGNLRTTGKFVYPNPNLILVRPTRRTEKADCEEEVAIPPQSPGESPKPLQANVSGGSVHYKESLPLVSDSDPHISADYYASEKVNEDISDVKDANLQVPFKKIKLQPPTPQALPLCSFEDIIPILEFVHGITSDFIPQPDPEMLDGAKDKPESLPIVPADQVLKTSNDAEDSDEEVRCSTLAVQQSQSHVDDFTLTSEATASGIVFEMDTIPSSQETETAVSEADSLPSFRNMGAFVVRSPPLSPSMVYPDTPRSSKNNSSLSNSQADDNNINLNEATLNNITNRVSERIMDQINRSVEENMMRIKEDLQQQLKSFMEIMMSKINQPATKLP